MVEPDNQNDHFTDEEAKMIEKIKEERFGKKTKSSQTVFQGEKDGWKITIKSSVSENKQKTETKKFILKITKNGLQGPVLPLSNEEKRGMKNFEMLFDEIESWYKSSQKLIASNTNHTIELKSEESRKRFMVPAGHCIAYDPALNDDLNINTMATDKNTIFIAHSPTSKKTFYFNALNTAYHLYYLKEAFPGENMPEDTQFFVTSTNDRILNFLKSYAERHQVKNVKFSKIELQGKQEQEITFNPKEGLLFGAQKSLQTKVIEAKPDREFDFYLNREPIRYIALPREL